MSIVGVIIAFFLFMILLLAGLAVLLKRRVASAQKRKIIFSTVAAGLFCPVLVPAAMTVIPLPHIVLLLFAYDELAFLPVLYARTWLFCAVSFFVTAGFFYVIAQMIFFEFKRS